MISGLRRVNPGGTRPDGGDAKLPPVSAAERRLSAGPSSLRNVMAGCRSRYFRGLVQVFFGARRYTS